MSVVRARTLAHLRTLVTAAAVLDVACHKEKADSSSSTSGYAVVDPLPQPQIIPSAADAGIPAAPSLSASSSAATMTVIKVTREENGDIRFWPGSYRYDKATGGKRLPDGSYVMKDRSLPADPRKTLTIAATDMSTGSKVYFTAEIYTDDSGQRTVRVMGVMGP
jgi:hypothetical protein